MSGYHKYVFDDGKFVGKFDEMYKAEETEGFDSWRQNDVRHMRLRLVREVLSDWNFNTVLDIGCGKGTFTQFLQKSNNSVDGYDTSPAALEKAQQSFPEINFYLRDAFNIAMRRDLISIQGTLSYVSDWRRLLKHAGSKCDWCCISEYVPPNPIGHVKSIAELLLEFERWFVVKTKILLNDEIVVLFGQSK